MSDKIRLDKFLADMGIGTRSEVKDFIRKKRVLINDEIADSPSIKVNKKGDKVYFDEILVSYEEFEYYMLNKPQGVVSATKDKKYKTVVDLISDKKRKDLFPIGRLDIDTEGLLVITNDGELAHALLTPGKHVKKKYYVLVKGKVTSREIELFATGLKIDTAFTAMPAILEIIKCDDISEVYVTIEEGKFHQIKRMFEAVDMSVIFLKRVSMGKLELDDNLKTGEFKKMTEDEIELLKDSF